MRDRNGIGRGLVRTRLRSGRTRGRPPWSRRGRAALWAALAATALTVLAGGQELGLWRGVREWVGEGATPGPSAPAPVRIDTAGGRPAAAARDHLLLQPPYDSLDGVTIVQGGYRLRLAGVEGPPRNGVCAAGDGRLWACGLQARAALHNLLAQKPLICRSVTPLVAGATVPADCAAEGEDVARALVKDGWARPTESSGMLGAERDEARRERRGLWDGDWTIRAGF